MEKFNRAWLEIDTAAFEHNMRYLCSAASPAALLAVLKADAYGLSAASLAPAAIHAGAARIGTATACEALSLRSSLDSASLASCPLQVMSAVFPEELPGLIAAGIELPLHEPGMLPLIEKTAASLGKTAFIHVKLDTGMGRLGILPSEIDDVINALHSCQNIAPVGIFTHFPRSTEHEPDYCRAQMQMVKQAILRFESAGFNLRWRHVANSDAICHLPEAAQSPFNLVRAGLAMHGLVDAGESRPSWLREVATFKTRIVSVRNLPAGSTIGYNATYRLDAPMRIGTLAAGYADGLPLALSNHASVLVNERLCPIVGRISMDYTTIDLTNAPEATIGTPVILFGHSLSPSIWATLKSTHPYDIICSISPRVPRIAI